MTKSNNLKLKELRVDGGGSNSKFLLSFQADMLNKPVVTGDSTEATVLGCIYLACVSAGILTLKDIEELSKPTKGYEPTMDKKNRDALYCGWERAVKNIIH